MTTVFTSVSGYLRDACERISDRCIHAFPCFCDPVRRSWLMVKLGMVAFHFVAVGLLFLFHGDLVDNAMMNRWYTTVYLFLLVTTLFQYFFTSGSSPGHADELIGADTVTYDGSPISRRTSSQVDSSEKESLLPSSQMDPESLSSFLTELYPHVASRNWICMYCKHVQPPRAKHCHDCGRCVLQFDHHCVWLGTCIGQKNHCRFWWYIFEESILCIWTIILYIFFLERVVHLTWWKEAFMIAILVFLFFALIFLLMLLFFHSYLVLSNQTTYELLRRRRIHYMRDVPVNVNPFSKGVCRNLYEFCFSCNRGYIIEALPTTDELEARSRPYTYRDIFSFRCC